MEIDYKDILKKLSEHRIKLNKEIKKGKEINFNLGKKEANLEITDIILELVEERMELM